MAKSIRSKWKRKCRAVKRIRYGEKELDRLKKVLANDPLAKNIIRDVEQEQKEGNKIPESVIDVESASTEQEQTSSMDIEEIKKEFNPKTLRDKNGAFPVWLHPRKIKSTKKNKKKKGNKKGGRVTKSRQSKKV